MRLVIIGGDAAGMSAASRFKRKSPDSEVIVLEQTHDVSYSACGMPYNISAPNRPIDDLVVRSAKVFEEKLHIDLRLGHKVTKIDPNQKKVIAETAQGTLELTYDKLLIATGASPILPDVPGIDLPGVMPLKSLEHGRGIKEYLFRNKVERAVIIGMGYIALEMAEALRTRGIDVAMVKPRPQLLPWMDPELSDMIKAELTDHSVALYAGQSIESIISTQDGMQVQCSSVTLPTDFVLSAIGIKPNSELAAQAGLELGPETAIAVDRSMRTSDPDIYAAGDCADAFHVVSKDRTWVPLALRANRAGWAVADHLLGQTVDIPGVAGTAVFKVFDVEVATTGLSSQDAATFGFEPRSVTIESINQAHSYQGKTEPIKAHLIGDARSGRLLGAQMVGRQGTALRINAIAVALSAEMSVEAFSQCDLAYAPPFGPVWDPLLTAANQLLKKL
ncbi:MAG: FAD-dependent oxidoreductase [Desulfovermiculus sp.]|nr:FAD-dependent oxidoreductase [Desulfovermiculus sp.]